MSRTVLEYHRPEDLAQAAALVQRADPLTAPLIVGPRVPDAPLAAVEAVVDLGRLVLDTLTFDNNTLRLGAGVSIQALVDSPRLHSLASGIVAEAAVLSAGSAMRHAATVGGLLAYARQAASGATRDGPPELLVALLVLGARVVEQSAGQAEVDLADYLAGNSGGGLVVEVRCPLPGPGARAALARVARTPRDQGMVAAAALIEGDAVRLAVAAGGAAPQRLTAVEVSLSGQPLSAELVASVASKVEAVVAPQSDFRASADYRRAMAGVLARRALSEAARRQAA